MEEKGRSLVNTCNFAGIRPIMVDLPYPPVQVEGQNLANANLLSIDHCGSIDFAAKQGNGKQRMWTPEYLTMPDKLQNMLAADVDAEKAAIRQYEMHRRTQYVKHHQIGVRSIVKEAFTA